MGNIFGVFEIAVGAYLLYSAITRKGQLYQADSIKKDQVEAYKKAVRLLCFIIGPMLMAQGAVDLAFFANPTNTLRIISLVMMGLTFAGVVVLFVIAFRMTDRTKKAAPAPAPVQKKPTAPRAAFFFEDEKDKQKPGEE